MSLTLAAIGGIVAAVVKYLIANRGAQIIGEKAMEKVGESSGEALVAAGKGAFHSIRQALTKRGEAAKKANKALADVEEDPDDKQYQDKLAIELEKLAANDPELSKQLEHWSSIVQQAQTQISGSNLQGSVNVSDQGKIYGPAAGLNTGNISVGSYNIDDKEKENDAKGSSSRS